MKRQLAGSADCLDGAFPRLNAGELDLDGVAAGDGDLGFLDTAEVLDPAPHDLYRHIDQGGVGPLGGRENDRHTALEVEAELGGHSAQECRRQPSPGDDEHDHESDQTSPHGVTRSRSPLIRCPPAGSILPVSIL